MYVIKGSPDFMKSELYKMENDSRSKEAGNKSVTRRESVFHLINTMRELNLTISYLYD